MRVATVFIALLVAGASLTIALWMTKSETLPTNKLRQAAAEPPLPISETGPWPVARPVETEFKFGVMEVGAKDEHAFKVVNDGPVPLQLKLGPTTCQCTLSELARNEIPPGDSAFIKLTWHPTAATEMFSKGATIFTNDPQAKQISLKLEGRVVKRLIVSPDGSWVAPLSSEAGPAVVKGTVYSETVEKFKILSADSSDPLLTTEIIPLTGPELEKIHAKSGYSVVATVQPNKTAGSFGYELLLKTDIPERKEDGKLGETLIVEKVVVTGSRRSSIHLIGSDYIEDRSLVLLGSFEATKGKSVEVQMIVSRCPEDGLKISDIVGDPPELKVDITPFAPVRAKPAADKPSTGKIKTGRPQRYKLTITYPPGSPRAQRPVDNPATISMNTNHPEMKEIHLNVSFSAY